MAPIPSMSNKIYEVPTISGHHSPIVLFLAKFGVLDFGTGWKRSNFVDVDVGSLPKESISRTGPPLRFPYAAKISAALWPSVTTASNSASPIVLVVNKTTTTPLADAISASIAQATPSRLSPSLTESSASTLGMMTGVASLQDFLAEKRDGEHHDHHGHHGHHHDPHKHDQSQQTQETAQPLDMDKDSPARRRNMTEVIIIMVVAAIIIIGVCYCIVRKCRHRRTRPWEVAKDYRTEHEKMQRNNDLREKGIYGDGLAGDRARAAWVDERVAKKEEENVKEGKRKYSRLDKILMGDKQYKRRMCEAYIRDDVDKERMLRSKERMLAERAQENHGRRMDRPADNGIPMDTMPPPTRPPPTVPPPTRSAPAVPSSRRPDPSRPPPSRHGYSLREGDIVEIVPSRKCPRHIDDPTLRPPRPEDREMARRMREQRGRRRQRESEI